MMDKVGNKEAKDLIAAIKVVAPKMTQTVADRAIQIYGGGRVCDDFPMAYIFNTSRWLRMADGLDDAHASQLRKLMINHHAS